MGHIHGGYSLFKDGLSLIGKALAGGRIRDGGGRHMVALLGKAITDGCTLIRKPEQVIKRRTALLHRLRIRRGQRNILQPAHDLVCPDCDGVETVHRGEQILGQLA